MTRVGKLLGILCGVATIATLQYKWIWLGVLIEIIDIVVWLFRQPSIGVKAEKQEAIKSKFTDHFIYYNLFDKHNRR